MGFFFVMVTFILEILLFIIPALVLHSSIKSKFIWFLFALGGMIIVNFVWVQLTGFSVLFGFIREFFNYNFG